MRQTKFSQLQFGALFFCVAILLVSLLLPEQLKRVLSISRQSLLQYTNYYLLYFCFALVGLAIILAILPVSNKKLGNQKPEYSFFEWIAMLYSTGMGAGLLLRAVQEPVYFYENLPVPLDGDKSANALKYVYLHWGFTPWAIYALFGLIMAYQFHQKTHDKNASKVPPFLQQTLNQSYIIVTLIGVIAALGLGSKQFFEGWKIAFEFNSNNADWTWLVVVSLCVLGTFSAIKGLKKGIGFVSRLNVIVALLLMCFVFVNGNMIETGKQLLTTLGYYLKDFTAMSLNLGHHQASTQYINEWTCFYWAFWLAWAPFTGLFFAKISQGRTIKEYLMGTIFIPSLGTFLWFTIFGVNVFEMIEMDPKFLQKFDSIYSALFNFLNALTATNGVSLVVMFLLYSFLLTSVDSAIYVLNELGFSNSKIVNKSNKVFWGLMICIVSIVLVLVGGSGLLDSMSDLLIVCAIPFSFVYLLLLINFLKKVLRKY